MKNLRNCRNCANLHKDNIGGLFCAFGLSEKIETPNTYCNRWAEYGIDVGKLFREVKDDEVILKDIKDEEELEMYLEAIYRYILDYLGFDQNAVDYKTKDFKEDLYIDEIEYKENNEVFRWIRDDILYAMKKDINYSLFEDKDFD